MKLTIIIPCLNEEKYIKECVESILSNDFSKKDYEIIIVDGGSDDNTLGILEDLKNSNSQVDLTVLNNPKKIPPVAMNIGISHAKGDIIMRLDTHAYYPANYISTLVNWKEKLNADNIGAVAKTEVLNSTRTSEAIKKVLSHKFGLGGGIFRVGTDKVVEVDTVPFGCYSKKSLINVGGYDERLKRNQDIELNKRFLAAGKSIFLIPYTYCIYYARETWKKLAKNNYQNGKWNLITTYYTKNIASLSLRHFIPLLFLLSLIIPALLSLISPLFLLLSVVSLGVYTLTLIYFVAKMNKKGTTFFHLFWTFIVLHYSYGLGSFVGLFHVGKLFKK